LLRFLRKEVDMQTIDRSGFDLDRANRNAWQDLVDAARAAGLTGVLTDVLADDGAPTVARVRAYSILGRKLTFTS
jgi:hypothetical protein